MKKPVTLEARAQERRRHKPIIICKEKDMVMLFDPKVERVFVILINAFFLADTPQPRRLMIKSRSMSITNRQPPTRAIKQVIQSEHPSQKLHVYKLPTPG